MKSFFHSPLLLTLVSLLFLHTSPVFGQAAPAKVKKIPFHGKIVALDVSGGTITLNGKEARVLHITSSTAVIDGSGNPTMLSAATVGEDVGGSYTKDASGTLTAAKLRIGAKVGSKAASTTPAPTATAPPTPAAAPQATPSETAATDTASASKPQISAKASHFSGKVTAVDASAGTLSTKSKTLKVTSASSITDSTGAASSLSAVTVGSKVSGTYNKATGEVVTLKIGK